MKVTVPVTVKEKCGQYYARWRSNEIVFTKKGETKKKQYFEPTGVPVPPGGAKDDIMAAKKLARDAGEYMAELTSPNRPSAELQQIKLKEFGLRSAKRDKNCIREFIPLWLIDYATTKDKKGHLPLVEAVWTMMDTWEKVLQALGAERELHPSIIPTTKLQSILNNLPGDKLRHKINIRCAYAYGVKNGKILKGHNPAEELEALPMECEPKIPYSILAIQKGLNHMGTIPHGDQWQLLTLCGIYSPMRFLTACRLQLMPEDFARPKKPRACSFLDTSRSEWRIEYCDTKKKKWETQIVEPVFVLWLKPYLHKHRIAPGDYVFPNFGRMTHAPSELWQSIMEASGTPMVYSENGMCRTGYHALRISQDKWAKENQVIALTKEEIEESMLRHGAGVHREHYDSEAINLNEQRRINQSRPKFLPGNCDMNLLLCECREKKHQILAELAALEQQEKQLLTQLENKPIDEAKTQ